MINFQLHRIRRRFNNNTLKDVKSAVQKELSLLSTQIKPGMSIAIAIGSRGIDNLKSVVSETVQFVQSKGANPFIVPAMGSHGGATAGGQETILKDYGIREEKIGAPVISSMEVVEITGGSTPNRLFMDKNAYESNGIILINKVKPHTDFRSRYESGLVKMSVIGLGKERGANAIHQFGVYGLSELLEASARKIFSMNKILGGIALLENAYDKTMMVKGLKAEDILDTEPDLLELAKKNRPDFPLDEFDLLILDRMGKNISGVGIDTNIIGRMKINGQREPVKPRIKSILACDLTSESHGNASGVGLADVITRKLYNKIDPEVTYTNIVTSSFLERGKIPVVAGSDREALFVALRSCGFIEPGKEKLIRVRDTLHLDELLISDTVLDLINGANDVEVLESGYALLGPTGHFNPF